MLTYILSFLPLSDQKEASLVSWAWYRAAQNALRERDVRYNIPVSSASLSTIKSLGFKSICCISLTNLDGSPASHQVLQSVAYHLGPHLQSLSLGGGSPTEAAFVDLILGCPTLRILDLSGCNSLFISGTLLAQPETAHSIRQTLSGLHELNLAGLRDLADLSFNRLSSCAPSLERLSLAYCHLTFEPDPARGCISPQDSSPSQFSFRNLLRFVQERAGRLHALDLSGTGLPPEALRALGQVAGLQLQELSLQSCRNLSTEAVATLCLQQPGLTSLDLSGCSELTDGALLAVSRGLRHLRHLSLGKLQRLTDVGCTALGGLRELQSLDMAECCLVRGWELARALGSVHGAPPQLASLSLAHCSSLKVSTPSCPSFLSRAGDGGRGNWGGGGSGQPVAPGRTPQCSCPQLAVGNELGTQCGGGQELRQLLLPGHLPKAPILGLGGLSSQGGPAHMRQPTAHVPSAWRRLCLGRSAEDECSGARRAEERG
ncbi:leucine-rich repeat-containing protein 29 isoform X2 [Sapajus apella]|nr:leucine-rich repeat-containing protein 29 isoform X2 [Sapajus apella]XP_032140109.1 leucine-rich repeat-containing protein 29 isoform X2 [Sapajus apella]